MPTISSLSRAFSMGLLVLGASGQAGAQCPPGVAGASPQDRVGVVPNPDPLCPKDLPGCGAKDAVIYLKMPSIQGTAGHSSGAYTADGLSSFMTVFLAAAAKGVENATIRAFNGSRACPDCKPGEPPTHGAATGGQVPLSGLAAEHAGHVALEPVNAPAGPTAAVGPSVSSSGAGPSGAATTGATSSGPAPIEATPTAK